MELLFLAALVVGLCGGPLWLMWYFASIGKDPLPFSATTYEEPMGSMDKNPKMERVKNLYLEGSIGDDEYEDLIDYVSCGGMITSQGDKVGISDAGYDQLQRLRERNRRSRGIVN